jgi:hypothetical protein
MLCHAVLGADLHGVCGVQVNIELDRALAAAEDGYRVRLARLWGSAPTTKEDVLVGVPEERAGAGMLRWPWLHDLGDLMRKAPPHGAAAT